MWRLTCRWDSDGHPLLHSLNGNVGRQAWVYDEKAGTPTQRETVERLRQEFAANRLQQKHSSDELLRLVLPPPCSVSCALPARPLAPV